MIDKVIMPLGLKAGEEIDLPHALQDLLYEMQKHQAGANFERYRHALWLIWWQVEDPAKREMQIGGGLEGWLEIASRLELVLPADLEDQARKDARKKRR